MIIVDITRQRQAVLSVRTDGAAALQATEPKFKETLIYRLTTQTCARPNLLTAAVNGHTGDVLRVCVRELTVQQRKLLEVEADVVLLGENVHGAAGLREQVQVELQRHS